MKTSHSNDAPVSPPADSRCKSRFNSSRSEFDFKKPRVSERNNSHPRKPLSLNRSKLNIPYKSQLCLLFQRGKCYYGENCHFSHSMREIGNPTLKPVAMKEHSNDDDSKRNPMLFKMRECVYFSRGADCPYGEKCIFLHKCDEKVERSRESHGIDTGEKCCDKSFIRKTKLCRKWSSFGRCPYGVRCIYAHGEAELQEPGFSRPNDASSCEVASTSAKKWGLKGRSYFMNWDIAKISQIYADSLEGS